MTAEPHAFQRFTATFAPKRTDDLHDGVAEWIGWTGEWWRYWIIEEEDSEEYAGQWACMVADHSLRTPFGWVPECDLVVEGDVSDGSVVASTVRP